MSEWWWGFWTAIGCVVAFNVFAMVGFYFLILYYKNGGG